MYTIWAAATRQARVFAFEPEAQNYANWNLTAAGIEFTYGEYQIAPGCAGLISVVVPYERLRDILKPGALPAELAAARP